MQNFDNHIRFYPLHHFLFYPVAILLAGIFINLGLKDSSNRIIWLSFFTVTFLIAWLSFMLRQHYALNNQNRIIRLEMRFRYYILTNKRLEEAERDLSFGQIAALRFASDEELPFLVERAIKENLAPRQIKKSITNWQGDLMRV